MTLEGTNGYVIPVGPGAVVAIDPGIDDDNHINAFVEAARKTHSQFVAIFVTHGHPDHFPGALALKRVTRAPIFAHRSAKFPYDRAVDDGMRLPFEDATFVALHAPGHAADHLVFWHEQERALFTGDVIIGTGTVVIAPPGGDMRIYQETLERLLRDYGHADAIYGGHGPIVRQARRKIEEYIAHRKSRESQIITVLEREPSTIAALVSEIYAEVDKTVWPAAARQVLAYLIALEREGRVKAAPMTRTPTADEAALLNPDLAALAHADDALARAELGLGGPAEPFLVYSLAA
jgi:glyoxylase-like metal-dependent hydrolase (beta-lactamase superfamily II)